MFWVERNQSILPIFFVNSENVRLLKLKLWLKFWGGQKAWGLLLVATHLRSPELLPPRPLCSAFSMIFCKPSALPFPFQPEGKQHVSGQKPWRPAFRPQESLRPRPSHPGLHARPPRVLPPRPLWQGLHWAASLRLGPGGTSAVADGPRSSVGVRLSLGQALFLRV